MAGDETLPPGGYRVGNPRWEPWSPADVLTRLRGAQLMARTTRSRPEGDENRYDARWRLAGEAGRRLGLTAVAARAWAVRDVTGDAPAPGEVYAVVLRSEWRMAQRL